MLVKLNSAALIGVEGTLVTIEVNVSNRGFPRFEIVGLPNKVVSESKERIIAAIKNSGFTFPNKKITVNLAPADIPKNGSNYDLPITLGILSIENSFSIEESALYAGELSLDGSINHTRGSFILGNICVTSNLSSLYVASNAASIAKLAGVKKVYGVSRLVELVKHFNSDSKIEVQTELRIAKPVETLDANAPEIFGQLFAKRALSISAAGGHHLLMMGPPGSGKTLLGHYLQYLLPPLSYKEALEVVTIHSLRTPDTSFSLARPFRAPHNSTTLVGLLGGGRNLSPGEVSLAHNGVLFLDEFLEFSPNVINNLRQPLEEGYIEISRQVGTAKMPSKFVLIAACNACPCGFYMHPKSLCKCTPKQIQRYNAKLSGPVLDRIDLHILVKPLPIKEISENVMHKEKSRSAITEKSKVITARKLQEERLREFGMSCNAEMSLRQIRKLCILDKPAKAYLNSACMKLNVTGRGYFKLLRVSRTIADLDNCHEIQMEHIAEALQYRFR